MMTWRSFASLARISSKFGDLLAKFVQLIDDLLPLQARQALQLHFENGLGLNLAEFELRDQTLAGFGSSLCSADQFDDLVDVIESFLQSFEDMGACFSLPQFVLTAPADDIDAMLDEIAEQLHQAENLWLPVDDGEIDHAESRLHLRELVQIVQDDRRLLAALEFDDDAHAIAIAFVANVGDAFEFLVRHQLRDLFDQSRLVDLVWNFGDDDDVAILSLAFDNRAGAHGDRAAAGGIGLPNSCASINKTGRWKIRTLNVLGNVFQVRSRDGS